MKRSVLCHISAPVNNAELCQAPAGSFPWYSNRTCWVYVCLHGWHQAMSFQLCISQAAWETTAMHTAKASLRNHSGINIRDGKVKLWHGEIATVWAGCFFSPHRRISHIGKYYCIHITVPFLAGILCITCLSVLKWFKLQSYSTVEQIYSAQCWHDLFLKRCIRNTVTELEWSQVNADEEFIACFSGFITWYVFIPTHTNTGCTCSQHLSVSKAKQKAYLKGGNKLHNCEEIIRVIWLMHSFCV